MGRRRKDPRTIRRGSAPGTPPGVLIPPAEAVPSQIRVIRYNAEKFAEETPASVDAITVNPDEILWIDVVGLANVSVFENLAKRFQLHPLAVEDAVSIHQRPKVDEYDNGFFASVRMPRDVLGEATEQIGVFVLPQVVITVQEDRADCFDPIRTRLREARGRLRRSSADYLAYAVIDSIVDSYFGVMVAHSDLLDELERRIFAWVNDSEALKTLYHERQQLLRLRRILWATRESVSRLSRGDVPGTNPEVAPFYRDCADHCAQLADGLVACEELVNSLSNLHLSLVNQRMNEIMKVLTLISTIFIPLTFVVGIYGMNFDTSSPWNMPELRWRYGYPVVMLSMTILTIGLLFYFRSKKWVGSGRWKPPGYRIPQTQQK